jgi:hypothetical protein
MGTAAYANDNTRPPVDINKPVENPALVAAINRLAKDQSKATKHGVPRFSVLDRCF